MQNHDKKTPSSRNVYLDLGFPPEEAAHLLIRSDLMIQIKDYIKKHNLKQKDVAERAGIAQPDVSAIISGKVQKFTIDKLITILIRLGYELDLKASKKRRTFSIVETKKKTTIIGNKKATVMTKQSGTYNANWISDLSDDKPIKQGNRASVARRKKTAA